MNFITLRIPAGTSVVGLSVSRPRIASDMEQIEVAYETGTPVESGLVYCMLSALVTGLEILTGPILPPSVTVTVPANVVIEGHAANADVAITPANLREPVARLLTEDQEQFMSVAMNQLPTCMKWLVQLAACEQVRPLKASNVKNYFASARLVVNNVTSLLKLVKFAAANLDSLMENEGVRDLVYDSEFMNYHTNAASSAQLVMRAIDGLGLYAGMMFSAEEIAAARAAAQASWNTELMREISTRMLAVTDVFLNAMNCRPEIWYQGERARNSVSPALLSQWDAMFRRYRDLLNESEVLERVSTISQLFSDVRDGNISLPDRSQVLTGQFVRRLDDTVRTAQYTRAIDQAERAVPNALVTRLIAEASARVGGGIVPVAAPNEDEGGAGAEQE